MVVPYQALHWAQYLPLTLDSCLQQPPLSSPAPTILSIMYPIAAAALWHHHHPLLPTTSNVPLPSVDASTVEALPSIAVALPPPLVGAAVCCSTWLAPKQ
jgi:hypothetical protein